MRGIRTRQAGNRGRALNYLNNNTGADCYGLRPVFRFAVIVFYAPNRICSRSRSAIIEINSLLVGFPLTPETV